MEKILQLHGPCRRRENRLVSLPIEFQSVVHGNGIKGLVCIIMIIIEGAWKLDPTN